MTIIMNGRGFTTSHDPERDLGKLLNAMAIAIAQSYPGKLK